MGAVPRAAAAARARRVPVSASTSPSTGRGGGCWSAPVGRGCGRVFLFDIEPARGGSRAGRRRSCLPGPASRRRRGLGGAIDSGVLASASVVQIGVAGRLYLSEGGGSFQRVEVSPPPRAARAGQSLAVGGRWLVAVAPPRPTRAQPQRGRRLRRRPRTRGQPRRAELLPMPALDAARRSATPSPRGRADRGGRAAAAPGRRRLPLATTRTPDWRGRAIRGRRRRRLTSSASRSPSAAAVSWRGPARRSVRAGAATSTPWRAEEPISRARGRVRLRGRSPRGPAVVGAFRQRARAPPTCSSPCTFPSCASTR